MALDDIQYRFRQQLHRSIPPARFAEVFWYFACNRTSAADAASEDETDDEGRLLTTALMDLQASVLKIKAGVRLLGILKR